MELFDGDEPGNKHQEAASYSTVGLLRPAEKKNCTTYRLFQWVCDKIS